MKLLLDYDVYDITARFLVKLGYNVLKVSEIGVPEEGMPVILNEHFKSAIQTTVVIAMILISVSFVGAQADCGYAVKIYVRDKSGKTIEGAKVSLNNRKRLYFENDSKAYWTFGLLGVGTPPENATLKVSAKGFKAFQHETTISCTTELKAVLTLVQEGSNDPTDFTVLAGLRGKVTDQTGAVIVGAEVRAISSDNRSSTATTRPNGFYFLDLFLGNHVLEYKAVGFNKHIIQNIQFDGSSNGTSEIDVVLFSSTSHEPCGYGGRECLKDEIPDGITTSEPKVSPAVRSKTNPTKP